MKKLMKLAKEAKTYEEFVGEALRWPRWYGFPGRGTRDDWATFWNMIRRTYGT